MNCNYQYPYTQPNYQQVQQMNVQNSGLVPVPSEEVARNYPIGYGQSVTFKDENAPYIYTKTMGFSQLDKPVFEKFKLMKENSEEEVASSKVDISVIEEIKSDIESLWDEVKFLRDTRNKKKKEVADD